MLKLILVMTILANTQTGTIPRPTLNPFGSCEKNGNSLDLSQALIIENSFAWFGEPSDRIYVEISNETVLIGRDSRDTVQPFELDENISPQEDIDISINVALWQGKPAVYWRENYQHRLYRQGVFLIERGNLVVLCEGLGGVSH